MACVDFGCDGGEWIWQAFDRGIADRLLQARCKTVATDQARTRQAEIEVTKHAAAGQGASPLPERVELTESQTPPRNRPDRGAHDHVGHDLAGYERAQHADVGEAARRSAAKHQPDGWTHRRPSVLGCFNPAVAV